MFPLIIKTMIDKCAWCHILVDHDVGGTCVPWEDHATETVHTINTKSFHCFSNSNIEFTIFC